MTRRVEFAETDMAGIMHFSNYFRYLESAEHAFFRSLGLNVHQNAGGKGPMLGWARVQASCDYLAPLRYQDEVEVHLQVEAKGSKSISYRAEFRLPDPEGSPLIVARARWKVVCVSKSQGEDSMHSVAIPPDVDAALQVAPPETSETHKDS
ncbi:MAG: thioesterase family protein [Planctomycetota bacterium]|nr:thioesterase family protein [Planctomycetota bacterium]